MTYFETTGLVKVFLQMVTFEWKIFIKGNDLLCNHRAGEGIFADVTFEWKIFYIKRNDLLCNYRVGEGIFADVIFEWKIKRNDLLCN